MILWSNSSWLLTENMDLLLSFLFFQSDGLLHTTCGTPNYVAPEV